MKCILQNTELGLNNGLTYFTVYCILVSTRTLSKNYWTAQYEASVSAFWAAPCYDLGPDVIIIWTDRSLISMLYSQTPGLEHVHNC